MTIEARVAQLEAQVRDLLAHFPTPVIQGSRGISWREAARVSVSALARAAGESKRTIGRRIEDGTIPVQKTGKRTWISARAAAVYLGESTPEPAAPNPDVAEFLAKLEA